MPNDDVNFDARKFDDERGGKELSRRMVYL
jgi:hypothetical protein